MLISSDRRGNGDSEVNSAPSPRHTAHRGWGCAGSRALLVLRPRLSLLGEASSGGLHGGLWAAAARPLPGVLSSLARGILETVTAWPLWTQPLFHLTNIYRAPTVIQVLFWVLGTRQ